MNNELFQLAGVIGNSDIGMDNRGSDKASACRQRKPGSARSADADPFGGPFGQVRYIFMKRNFKITCLAYCRFIRLFVNNKI